MPIIRSCCECSKDFSKRDLLLPCDMCKFPAHAACAGLNDDEADILRIKSSQEKVFYQCSICYSRRSSLSEILDKMETLQEQGNKLQTAEKKPSLGVEDLIEEMKDGERREKSIILFNLAESGAEDLEQRKKEDEEVAVSVLKKVCTDLDSVVKAVRLGNIKNVISDEPPRPRPLKVSLHSKENVIAALKSKWILQSDSGVRIKADLTYLQRENLSNLRKELEDKKNKGNTNFTIKYVNNIPRIVSTSPNN